MKVEVLDACKNNLIFEVSAARFEEGLNYAYNKNKYHINVPGFRRGKAPRKLIESQFGKEVFYEDAMEYVLPDAYKKAAEESGLDIITQPQMTGFEVQPDKSIVFTALVYTKPVITLGNYKGLTYKKTDVNPTEAEIKAQIEEAREKNSREISITDRPVRNGDIVIIDYTGYLDNQAFEGGEGKDYRLVIGSHSFIDNFEEQLIGHEVGETVTIYVRFPDEYPNKELIGKNAEFIVCINEIKVHELPELDDDFASDVSEFDTLEEYKASIAQKIMESKINNSMYDMENQLVRQLIKNSEVLIPDFMIESHIDSHVQELKEAIESKGMPFDRYLVYLGQSLETLRESYRKSSIESIQGNLLLAELVNAEGIEADEDEVEKQLGLISQANTSDINDRLDQIRSDIVAELKLRKALNLIIEHSQVVEDDGAQKQEDLA